MKFQNGFGKEWSGKIKDIQGRVRVKNIYTPLFLKPRRITFALKRAVQDKINELANEGILQKADSSDWATPIAPITESESGKYKVK